MKAKELFDRLKPALSVISPRSAIPIMQCLRIGGGQAIGTDCNAWVTIATPEIDLPDMCVSADALSKALSITIPASADVTLEHKDGKLVVKGGGRRATLATQDAADYPMPKVDGEWLAEADAAAFSGAAHIVAPAASNDDSKFHMCGVAWAGPWLVASDSAILIRHPAPTCPMDDAPLMPTSVVALMPQSGIVRMNGQQALFAGDGISVLTRLIDGRFPDYERIFPTTKRAIMHVNAVDLRDLAEAVGWTEGTKSRAIVLEYDAGILRGSARSAGGETEACGEIEAKCEDGLRITFNSAFLRTVLEPFEGAVTVTQDEPRRPCLITQEGVETQAIITELRG